MVQSQLQNIGVDSSSATDELSMLDLASIDLDIFALSKRNTRKRTFLTLTQHFVQTNLQFVPEISLNMLQDFLSAVYAQYEQYNVSYHNEMHSLDVAHMSYVLLKTGPDCLALQLQLTQLEQFTAIIAATCHDFAHDGFNNGYHVAQQTARFTEHGKDGVQERFHFAESYKLIQQTQLLDLMSRQDQDIFKNRMQQCIYATDMSRHMSDLQKVKAILEDIPAGSQILPESLDEETRQSRKTKLLELVVHASDISFLARPQEAQRTQAYNLFEEFFHQGDLEKENGLPISFLCDRTTVNVAKSQSGFIKFGPLPLFKIIGQICPTKEYIIARLEASGDAWDGYVDQEEKKHKNIYTQIEGAGVLDDSWQ